MRNVKVEMFDLTECGQGAYKLTEKHWHASRGIECEEMQRKKFEELESS